MGKSKSIADLQSQNDDFSKYIAHATENLKQLASSDQKTFDQAVKEFYEKNNWDQQPIASGLYMDYHQEAEFSADSIRLTLKAVADAIFKGSDSPNGTVLEHAEAVATVVAEIASFEALALSASEAFVINILSAFDTNISVDYHSIVKSQTLAPGLMLHAWNFGDAFHQSNYFNNEFIIENAISFKLIFSIAQAAMENEINYMDYHRKQIEDQEEQIESMQKMMDKMTIDPDCAQSRIDAYQSRIDGVKKQLQIYRQEVDEVVKKYGGHS